MAFPVTGIAAAYPAITPVPMERQKIAMITAPSIITQTRKIPVMEMQ
jgi:hypothetical protein